MTVMSGVRSASDTTSAFDALRDWAPIVRFDSHEQYFPSSVDWFLQRADLVDSSGTVRMSPASANQGAMVAAAPGDKQNWNLVIHDDGHGSVDTTRAGCNPAGRLQPGDLRAYAWSRPVPKTSPQQYDLVYFFFYPFNGSVVDRGKLDDVKKAAAGAVVLGLLTSFIGAGAFILMGAGITAATLTTVLESCAPPGLNNHEGDWESVIVRVEGDLDSGSTSLVQVYFSQHSGGAWVPGSQVELSNGRPVVYSARNSHASFPHAGSDPDRVGGFCPEYFDGGGAAPWDTQAGLLEVEWDTDAFNAVAWNDEAAGGATPVMASKPTSAPAVACSTGDYAVEIESNGDALYYRAGLVQQHGALSFPANPVRFDTGGSPSVAISDDGVVVSVHRGQHQGLWINVGAIDERDPAHPVVNWWKSFDNDVASQIIPPAGLDARTAVAIDPHNTVVALIGGLSGARVGVVQIDPTRLHDRWHNPVSPVPAQSIVTIGKGLVAGAGIAVNRHGTVLIVGETTNSQLRAWVGHLADGALALLTPNAGLPLVQPGGVAVNGQAPSVVLTDDGEIVVTAMSGSHEAFALAGRLTLAPGASPAFEWPAGELRTFVHPKDAVSLVYSSNHEVVTACYRDQSTGRLMYYAGEVLDPNEFDNWNPPQPWLKFNGRWGRDGTRVILEVGGFALRCREDGPTGLQMKGVWFRSPDQG